MSENFGQPCLFFFLSGHFLIIRFLAYISGKVVDATKLINKLNKYKENLDKRCEDFMQLEKIIPNIYLLLDNINELNENKKEIIYHCILSTFSMDE